MTKILRFLVFSFLFLAGYLNTQAQTQFWSDNFEDSGAPSAGSRALSIAEKSCASGTHYFLRTDGTNISVQSGAYSSYQGSKFFAFEDIDYLQSCLNNSGFPNQKISWSGIDISGKTGLSFKGLFGANSVSFQDQATFPSNYDYMEIYYRIDGGSWNKIIGIYAHSPIVVNGVSNITPLAQDTNGDLIGDGAYLTYAMSELSANIPATGTTLDLEFRVSNNATVQEMAIDDFRLFSSSAASPLSASISSQTNVSCNGGSNGRATVTASGGTTPYSYSWAPSGGIAATATGLSAGTYTVTVTDNVAATTTATVTITQPTAITSSVSSQTNVSCNGGSNGSATITASGGTGTKIYSWAPSGGTAATATGLAAGIYTVTITDDNSCSKIQTVNISQPAAITSSISSQTNVSCNGGTNGSATITASGGTGTLTYSWAPSGGTAATATGLSAGTYTVTITDANTCSKIQTVAITQPTAITSSVSSQTNVSCNGGSNGSATITASGGTGTKTYSWAPSGGTAATATGLAAGIYTVTITDANTCSKIQTVNISQPTALTSSVSTQTNVSCNGGSNGSATITASGGTGTKTYSWAPSGGTAATATGLSAGIYTVTITDANTCSKIQTVNISQPTAITSSISSQTNVSVNGGADGSATITASGGTGTKTYSWAPSGGTAATATGLSAGTYTVTITDANTCSKIQTVNISQPTTPSLTASLSSQTNISCNGGTNGSATVTASGGTGPYSYSWAPSGGIAATATGLSAGTYTVTVTDNVAAITTATVTISQPAAITSSVSTQTNVSCNGGSNGSATITASGGTGTLTYSWAPSGGTASTATGLSAGIYTVTITDANTCSKIQTVNISQPTAITSSVSTQTNVSCNGGSNGSATITASGGTGTKTYSWAPSGGTAATATGLAAGIYTVTITDANTCTKIQTVNISQPTAITSSVSTQTNVGCNGGSNGSATITASGGTGTLTYSWAPSGGTASTATGLSAGIYTVTITDANTCTKIQTVNISQPTAITSSVSTQTNVSCNGGSNGSATITASGGTGTKTYSWAPSGGTAATATGLAVGIYTVTITDANTCTKIQTVNISQPTAITSSVSTQTNVSCNGGSNGSATITASGGTGTLTYSWAPSGGTAATATGLSAGTYTVTITDANTCSKIQTVNISQPTAITSSVSTQTNVSCNGGSNGSATITTSGGTGTKTYSWAPSGGTAATATGLAAGIYTVTITDANTCTKIQTVAITQPTAISTTGSQINVSTYGGSDGSATVIASGGTGSYSYSWAPSGGTASTANGLVAGTYTVTVTDANSCVTSRTFTITQPSATTVTSIKRIDSDPANGSTVNYEVTFAAPVSGLSSSNFSFTAPDLTGASVDPAISGSGKVYTVKVNTGSGSGSLALNLLNSTGILPPVNNVPFTSGEVYNIDRVVPTASISTPSVSLTKGGPVTYTITYADDHFNSSTLNSSDVTVNRTGTAAVSNVIVSGSGLTRTVELSGITGNGTVGISLSAATATDQAGNSAPASGPSATFEVDNTNPIVSISNPSIASINTGSGTVTYTVTYADANFDAASLTASAVSLNTTGTANANVDVSGSGTTYTVTVSNITGIGTLGISLSAGTASDKVNNQAPAAGPSATFDVTRIDQHITFNALPAKTYGDADFNPGATSDNNSTAISYTSDNTSVATIIAGKIHIVGVGTTVITASQAQDATHNAAADKQQTLTVGQKSLTVTLNSTPVITKIYNGTNEATLAAGNYMLSGVIGTDDVTISGTASYDNANAGTGKTVTAKNFMLSGNKKDNYSLSTVTANTIGNISTKAIIVTADARSKTYGDADPALTYQVTSGTLITGDNFSGSLTRDAGENVGSYAIKQGTLALSNNYTLTYAGANLSIGKKAITVTADARSKTYGDADPALTYQVTSGTLITGDNFSGSLTRDAGENVGSYAIKQGTLALSNNYTLTYAGANLSIGKKAITVTADARSKTYGDADPALTYQVTTGALVTGDNFTGSLTRDAGENVGSYAIKQGTLALSSNYTLTYTGANLSIGKKAITVNAAAKSKVYGAADPALTYTYTPNLIAGDSFSGSLTRNTGEAVGTYAIKQGTLALSNNYALTYNSANLTIVNATLTVTVQNQSKIYGSANPAFTINYSGFVNGDTQAGLTAKATASTTATTASVVGTYPITASGAAMPGYTINYVPGVLTVNKAIVNVTAEDKSRNYGLTNPPLTVTYTGFVNNDTSASLTTPATASTNANIASAPGKYAIIASGATSPNYNFTYSSGTFTVIPLTNAVMANLQISSGNLSPVFNSSEHQYNAFVTYATDQVTLTPTADPTATISINGSATANGVASAPIALTPGDNAITVIVTAQDASTKQTYTVTVHRALPPADIIPTNVLSPNGDGKNDEWVIKDIELYPNNKVTIYDRAGREIYTKRGYGNDWNGTLNGAPLAQGTYYYIIDLGPGYETLKGFITIIKNNN